MSFTPSTKPTGAASPDGTLPGHPERGEEAFIGQLDPDGAVYLSIRAFFRPATLLARAGGPLTRTIQRLVTDRFVRALRDLTRQST